MEVDLIRQFIDNQLPNLNWLWTRCQKKSRFTFLLPSLLFADLLGFTTPLEQHSRFIIQGSLILKASSQCTTNKFDYGLGEVFFR